MTNRGQTNVAMRHLIYNDVHRELFAYVLQKIKKEHAVIVLEYQ
jgi:hypothetical protein